LTQLHFLREVIGWGFEDRVDFVYVPQAMRRRQSRGFAFLNFRSAALAKGFANFMHSRGVEVSPADVQGFEDCVARHLAKLMDPSALNKPLVFRDLPTNALPSASGATAAAGHGPTVGSVHLTPSRAR